MVGGIDMLSDDEVKASSTGFSQCLRVAMRCRERRRYCRTEHGSASFQARARKADYTHHATRLFDDRCIEARKNQPVILMDCPVMTLKAVLRVDTARARK
jgi:hypothetical protein